MTLKKVLPVAWDYVVLTFGTLLYCLAWVSFMIPNNISSGGLTGACTILQYATMGAIPMAISFFVLNVLLIISGSIVLGKGFEVMLSSSRPSCSRFFLPMISSRRCPGISSI